MKNLELFKEATWKPLAQFGLTHQFWSIFPETLIYTWIVLGVLIVIIGLARYAMKKQDSIGQYLVLSFTNIFKEQVTESIGYFAFNHFAFVTSLFIFIVICNTISLIPFVEEPTIDINTTLGLGLTSFIYIQGASIRANGFIGYIKQYFYPFFLFFPVNVIGHLSSVISISFRLFGNIFGGSVIMQLWSGLISGILVFELLGIISFLNLLITGFFILFEGFIQAFVFAMLSLTYLAAELHHEE